MSVNEKEFYKRGVVDKILDHKKMILFILFSFVVATLLYLLTAQKIYTTDAVVEVTPKLNQLNTSVKLQSGESVFFRHLQTQIDFLQSRFLIEKVVKKLHANVHYFQRGRFAYERIAEDLPFEVKYIKVGDPAYYKRTFAIERVDAHHYKLVLMPKRFFFDKQEERPILCAFDRVVRTPYFDIAVESSLFKNNLSTKRLYFRVFDLEDYIDQVNRNLTVLKNSENSSMIKIVYADTNPYAAKLFVDTLVDEFLKVNLKNEISEAEGLLALINEKLAEEKKRLEESEQKLKHYIQSNRVAGIDQQTNQMINTIYQYEQKLENLRITRHKIDNILKLYKNHYDYKEILALIQELQNENLVHYINSIVADEEAYAKLRLRYKPKHPDLVKLRSRIASKRQTLYTNLKELYLENQKQSIQLKSYIDKYRKDLGSVPQREFGYTRLKRNHDILEKHYLFLLDKKTQIMISKQVQGVYDYRVIDYAYVAHIPSKPKKGVLLLLALVLGTILGVLYALIVEYYSKYIKVPSEVEEMTSLPYLGTIPYIKDKKLYKDLFVLKAPQQIASQMIWSLRTTVEEYAYRFRKVQKGGTVIAVTSIIKGEGKTSIAANLALSFGMGDKKTVVVGMDMRLPELHVKFGLENQRGLGSVLFANGALEDVTYISDELPNFAIIPSGGIVENPLRIINSTKIDEVLEDLRAQYDYIILDLPPVGVAAEAMFLMKKVDLVISVLKANYSEKSFVAYMESISIKHGIENIGFVLNGVDRKYIKILSRKENIKYIKHHQEFTQKGAKKERKFRTIKAIFEKIFKK